MKYLLIIYFILTFLTIGDLRLLREKNIIHPIDFNGILRSINFYSLKWIICQIHHRLARKLFGHNGYSVIGTKCIDWVIKLRQIKDLILFSDLHTTIRRWGRLLKSLHGQSSVVASG
jgi:hypothetical protein